MRRIVFLLVALAGVLVCAPADAGCGKLHLPRPFQWLKQRKESRAVTTATACPFEVTVSVSQAAPRESAGIAPTIWAAPMAGSPCANGSCGARGRRK